VRGLRTRFHLYTVPGQSFYNASRRLVLEGVDGVVFVVDSQITKLDENVESYLNLWDNLMAQGEDPARLALVLQMNKRDLPGLYSITELTELLDHTNSPVVEAVAVCGSGVFETLKTVCKQVIARSV
jgi:signal recognition particle receptor subunit beta